jgi:hypothetical protein
MNFKNLARYRILPEFENIVQTFTFFYLRSLKHTIKIYDIYLPRSPCDPRKPYYKFESIEVHVNISFF